MADGGCGEWRAYVHDPTQLVDWQMFGYVFDFPDDNRIGVATGMLLNMANRSVYGLVGFQHVVTGQFHMAFLSSTNPPLLQWVS